MKKGLFLIILLSFVGMISFYVFFVGKDSKSIEAEGKEMALSKVSKDPESYLSFSSENRAEPAIVKNDSTETYVSNSDTSDLSQENALKLADEFIAAFYEYSSIEERNQELKHLMTDDLYQEYRLPEESTQLSEVSAQINNKSLYISPKMTDTITIIALVDLSIQNVPQSMFIQIDFHSEDSTILIDDLSFKSFISENQ
ncbi:hypothetical protein [Enterococcus innesii]|uniref:hypothetical protein n=1 Tax=Enterococcus innesii TaxID=2839759 RepID=UPI00232D6013|nr:hypothetical protein [Enterococcus innesii]MDC0753149.1 hypothetical protein [Enterococcus innesii]MDC0777238.1 hypothetical protein [Enterococcus innesii]MDC0780648.1 hypothetical protein [Enterococcus innesii]MDC0783983.1 hypothetical protein [Enterococcus innesii]